MDQTQEQMKFIGIFSQSFKIIFKWKKIFAQITLTLILPLAIIFIIHMEISSRFFSQIEQNPFQLFTDASQTYRNYYNAEAIPAYWLSYFLFKTISIAFITVFSLLSTAAVVYTIASIYTDCDVTYRKAMKAVPKVWKRLTVTFLSMFLMLFAYHLITAVVVFLWFAILRGVVASVIVLLPIFLAYIVGCFYLSMIWQVAIVVSVLESSYGLKAMIKSMDLMMGKRKIALLVSFLLYLLFAGVVLMYLSLIMYDNGDLAPVWKVMIGIICCVLLVITFLLFMVVQTVLYLVCKSHHRETIDKVSVSTYLGAYLSDSRPAFMVGEDIQLGRPQNQPPSQV